ncbi:MAG TPA: hypothetical protein PKA84_08185, partial [Rubrivivax sp.]|nr:hypothetical protein [Rubrivivax sp.]
ELAQLRFDPLWGANKDGDISSCKSSKPSSDAPPDQCQSAIRVELVPIAAELPAAKKDGEKKDGEKKEDTAKKGAKPPENPCGAEGFVMVGGKCSRADSGAAHLCNPSDSDDCKAQCDKGDMGSCHNYAEAVFANFCNDPSKKQVCDETNGAENDKREAEAVGYWRQACDKGDIADACAQTGNYLLTGFKLVKADKPVALAALDKGCQLGKADSCFLLGDSYLKGDEGLKKDTMKGLGLVDRGQPLEVDQRPAHRQRGLRAAVAQRHLDRLVLRVAEAPPAFAFAAADDQPHLRQQVALGDRQRLGLGVAVVRRRAVAGVEGQRGLERLPEAQAFAGRRQRDEQAGQQGAAAQGSNASPHLQRSVRAVDTRRSSGPSR